MKLKIKKFIYNKIRSNVCNMTNVLETFTLNLVNRSKLSIEFERSYSILIYLFRKAYFNGKASAQKQAKLNLIHYFRATIVMTSFEVIGKFY